MNLDGSNINSLTQGSCVGCSLLQVVVTDNEIRKDTRLYMANAITFKVSLF